MYNIIIYTLWVLLGAAFAGMYSLGTPDQRALLILVVILEAALAVLHTCRPDTYTPPKLGH